MREIKFRAWDEVNRKMHYGDGGFEFNPDGCIMQNNIFVSADVDDGAPIMQYTERKDSGDVEIYEGDILHAEGYFPGVGWYDTGEHDYEFTDKVEWDSHFLAYKCGGYYLQELDQVKVIGNIYEQPELLEVE